METHFVMLMLLKYFHPYPAEKLRFCRQIRERIILDDDDDDESDSDSEEEIKGNLKHNSYSSSLLTVPSLRSSLKHSWKHTRSIPGKFNHKFKKDF